jgi:hypothetical protein
MVSSGQSVALYTAMHLRYILRTLARWRSGNFSSGQFSWSEYERLSQTLRAEVVQLNLVLLIGCVNLTDLLAARNAGRRHEIVLKLALGASLLHSGQVVIFSHFAHAPRPIPLILIQEPGRPSSPGNCLERLDI